MTQEIRSDRNIQPTTQGNNTLRIGEDTRNRSVVPILSDTISTSSIESTLSSLEKTEDDPQAFTTTSKKALELVLSALVEQKDINSNGMTFANNLQEKINHSSEESLEIKNHLSSVTNINKKLQENISKLEIDTSNLNQKIEELKSSIDPMNVVPKTILAAGAVTIGILKTINN